MLKKNISTFKIETVLKVKCKSINFIENNKLQNKNEIGFELCNKKLKKH